MCPLAGENWDSQFSARTYREPETPDRPSGRSAVEAAADYYFSIYKQEQAKREAEEKARLERQRQREAAERERQEREKAAQAHRERLAAYEVQQHFIVATMESYGLSPQEQGELTSQLAERGLANDLNSIEFACQRIVEIKNGGGR